MTVSDGPLEVIRRYYDGCTGGDVALMTSALHPDVVHWFLAPNVGSSPVTGADHLARYWRKVARYRRARWVVESWCGNGDRAVIEWTMYWSPDGADHRVATRGTEWFVFEDGLIREIRSYHQLQTTTTELEGFPYAERGYSTLGREWSDLHPETDQVPAENGVAEWGSTPLPPG